MRVWTAAGIAALVVAAIAIGASTMAAQPSPSRIVGVAAILDPGAVPPGPPPPQSVEARVHALGISWIRQDFVRRAPGRVDQQRWDSIFTRAARAHIHVLPIFTHSEFLDLAFVNGAVARYGPLGTFWRLHPRLDSRFAPTWWEVGNEPWLEMSPGAYAIGYKAAVASARIANPRTRFLLAAYAAWQDPRDGSLKSWVDPMYDAVPDLNDYVDGWTDHPYCNGDSPGDWQPGSTDWMWQFKQFTRVHDEFERHGAGSLPMWITEFGYPTSGARSVDPALQAKYLRDAGRILSQYSYARALFVYQLVDWGPRDGDREHYFGIIGPNGAQKPAWAAVRSLALGS